MPSYSKLFVFTLVILSITSLLTQEDVLLSFSGTSPVSATIEGISAFPIIGKEENCLPIITNDDDSFLTQRRFLTDNVTEDDFDFGQAVRITPSRLVRGEYSISRGQDGFYHCIWSQELTTRGISLCYSHSTDHLGLNWTSPEILLRLESSIINPIITVDNNGTIHIVFISERTNYQRIYYLNKLTENESWSEVKSLLTSDFYKFSSLTVSITNNETLNVAWISIVEGSYSGGYWDSLIHFNKREGASGQWLPEAVSLYNSSNPTLVSLVTSSNDTLQMSWMAKNASSSNYEIMFTDLIETNQSWSLPQKIYSADKEITDLTINPSNNGGAHFLWKKKETYSKLYHQKREKNGTLLDSPLLVSSSTSNGYIGGIFEDKETENLYFIYEENYGVTANLFWRKKLKGNSTWDPKVQLTTDYNSMDPIFLPSPGDENNLVRLFYLSNRSIVSRSFDTNEDWSNLVIVFKTAHQVYEPVIAVDSEGTIHLVCEHERESAREIFYQKKLVNETFWSQVECLSVGLDSGSRPAIIVDSEDTLHCLFFAQDNQMTGLGIFYLYKTKEEADWTKPKLIHSPEGSINEHESPKVLLDENDSLHILWLEFSNNINKLFYAQKAPSIEEFSEPLLSSSSEDSSFYHLFALIDSYGTIHLVHGEYIELSEATEIVYQTKPLNSSWTEPVIVASSSDVLLRPILAVNSEGMLQLFISKNLPAPEWITYKTYIELYEKPLTETSWTFTKAIISERCINDNYNIQMLLDDTIYFVFHERDYSDWPSRKTYIAFMEINLEGNSSVEKILFEEPGVLAPPIIFFNPVKDDINVIFETYKGASNYFNWLYTQKDEDNDFLGDQIEGFYCSDPLKPDTDSDGLFDGIEVRDHLTNPIINDTDWDQLTDGEEVLIYQTDPIAPDSDYDHLTDGEEVLIYDTNPNSFDSDNDLITDFDEIFVWGTNPNDGDTDADGMDDHWEIANGLNPKADDAANDEDNDNLTNLEEFIHGTDIYNPDCDDDLLLDGEEVKIWFTNPLEADTDNDTITDWEEIRKFGTNPFLADSDNDGYSDRDEIDADTDPNNPRDNIRARRLRTILPSIIVPIVGIGFIIVPLEANYRIKTRRIEESEKEELEREEKELEKLKKEREKVEEEKSVNSLAINRQESG